MTPSQDLNSMSTFHMTCFLHINSWFVVHKVRVDSEASLHWSIVVDLGLYAVSISSSHYWSIFAHVLLIGHIRVLAWSWTRFSLAISRRVRETLVSDYTSLFQVLPGPVQITSIAAHVSLVTFYQVFWRQYDINFSIRINAESVWKCFRRTKSPARSTLLLVSDRVDAVCPLCSRIKGSWHLFIGYLRLRELSVFKINKSA